jgi:hypothetical protein
MAKNDKSERLIKSQAGIGFIELMIAVSFLSVVVLGVSSLNVALMKQNAQVAQLGTLKSYFQGLANFVGDNPSWQMTVANNASMGCLRNGSGSSCPVGQRTVFDIYDPNGGLIYGSTDGRNGITMSGLLCGPHSRAPFAVPNPDPTSQGNSQVYFNPTNADLRCPLRYEAQWIAMDNNPYPVVGVSIVLYIGKTPAGTPVVPLVFNPYNYSYNCDNSPYRVPATPWCNPVGNLPTTSVAGGSAAVYFPQEFVYRSAGP